MKKLFIPVIIGISLGLMGFSSRLPLPMEGIYPVKQKTLTYFDLLSKDIELSWNNAEITESKPDDLIVEFDDKKLSNPQYGRFALGNKEKQVWFLMGQDAAGYWTEFYIDQNLDNHITDKEKVKGFQVNDGRLKSFKTRQAFGLIPIPVEVSYRGQTGEFKKKLFFFLSVTTVIGKEKDGQETVVGALCASYFEGTMKVLTGKKEKLVKFRILDADGNGCFYDFGTDMFFMDLNQDGYFKRSEGQKLYEFFDVGSNKDRKQYHLMIKAFPGKVGVIEATEEYNPIGLEPVIEPEASPDKENVKTVTEKKDSTPVKEIGNDGAEEKGTSGEPQPPKLEDVEND
jgi:hypothetical protein